MKEIKFRAWDKKEKRMWCFSFEQIRRNFGFDYGIPAELSPIYNTEIPDENFMQFTGLLDKNGKEIYEGDIIQVDSPCDKNNYEVKFFLGEFRFHKNGDNHYTADYMQECIVVGDIYENPELVKQ